MSKTKRTFSRTNILIDDISLMAIDWAARDRLWSRGEIIAAAIYNYVQLGATDRDLAIIRSKGTTHGKDIVGFIGNDDRRKP